EECNGISKLLALGDIISGCEVSGGVAIVPLKSCERDVHGHTSAVGAHIVPVGLGGGAITKQDKQRIEADGGDAGIAAGLAHHSVAEFLGIVKVDERGVPDNSLTVETGKPFGRRI